MNNYLKILFSVVFVFFSAFAFAQNGERVRFPEGKFSFCPPAGWGMHEIAGLKYEVAVGPAENGFSANIVFADESYEGNLKEYIDLNIIQLGNFIQNYELVDRKAIRTNSGISGEYIVIKHEQYGFVIRQVIYFLPVVNNKYFVMTCSVLDNVFLRFLPVFENSMKTFEIF
jgi:hypothetical protein